LPDGFEQLIACLVTLLINNKAFLYQGSKCVQYFPRVRVLIDADFFGGFQSPATREQAQAIQ
jgi:hypothetical protein